MSARTKKSTVDPNMSTEDTGTATDPQGRQVAKRRPSEDIAAELVASNMFDEADLRNISTFDDALALAAGVHGDLADAAKEIGDGFALLDADDKSRLVGLPVLFMEWNFYEGDFGAKFVAVRCVTRNPDGGTSKYIFNDGSTGICDSLAAYQNETGRTGGLLCRNGLRESRYTYCEQCGRVVNPQTDDADHARSHKSATTYYLDTSAS